MLGNWNDFIQLNFPGITCDSSLAYDGYPAWAGGYAAGARAMLAAAASLSVPEARSAYALWQASTPLMDKDYPNNPTWAIVP